MYLYGLPKRGGRCPPHLPELQSEGNKRLKRKASSYHDVGNLGNTVVYVKPKGTSGECQAKIKVDIEIDGLGSRHEELVCCLYAPHPEYRHMNPRIQATIGGERWTDDPQWSYYLEKIPSPVSFCFWCGMEHGSDEHYNVFTKKLEKIRK